MRRIARLVVTSPTYKSSLSAGHRVLNSVDVVDSYTAEKYVSVKKKNLVTREQNRQEKS